MKNSDTTSDDFVSSDATVNRQDVRDEADEAPTDWELVQSLSVDEVMRAALDDPDAQPMSAAQLERMRRVPNPRHIRQQLGNITQERFARLFQIPVGTLRDWEQGVHVPDSPAKALLRTIENDPVAVTKALNPTMSIQEIVQQLGQDVRVHDVTGNQVN
jgi:putative transcriptional regulator